MDTFTESNLKALLDQKVTVKDDQGTEVKLMVKKVESGMVKDDQWDSFCVTLRGDDSFHVPQGNYSICHDKIGECQLFMTPNSQTEYEIIVSRKRDA